jgi:hypothetical protein
MMASAGLAAVSALAWFSNESSCPAVRLNPVLDTPDMKIAVPCAPPDAGNTAGENSEAPPVDTAGSTTIEDVEKRVEGLSKQVGVARKTAGLRAELDAVAGIADVQNRNEAIAQICYQWGEFDPRGAVVLACEHGLDQTSVFANLTQQWASVDFPAARAWIDAQPPSEIRAHLVARVAFLWAKTEPESAAKYIVNELPPGEIQTEAAISVLHQWAQQDRDAATAWARQFGAGELRERALGETQAVVADGRSDGG